MLNAGKPSSDSGIFRMAACCRSKSCRVTASHRPTLLEQAVDDERLIPDAERLQFVRRAGGFFERRVIGTAHQHEAGCGRVGKRMYGLLVDLLALFQSRQLAEARRAVHAFADKGAPCQGSCSIRSVCPVGPCRNDVVVVPLNLPDR